MNIIAQDEKGNIFKKEISFEERNDKTIISFGGYSTYYMETLFSNEDGIQKNKDGLLYLDLAGRNHKNSPVFVKNKDILKIPEVQEYLKINKI